MKKGIETAIKQVTNSNLELGAKKFLVLKYLYMDFSPELKKEIRENKDKYPDSLLAFLFEIKSCFGLYNSFVKTKDLVKKTPIEENGKAKDDENEMLKKQNKELKEQNEELGKLVKDAMNTILGLYNTFGGTKFEQLK